MTVIFAQALQPFAISLATSNHHLPPVRAEGFEPPRYPGSKPGAEPNTALPTNAPDALSVMANPLDPRSNEGLASRTRGHEVNTSESRRMDLNHREPG